MCTHAITVSMHIHSKLLTHTYTHMHTHTYTYTQTFVSRSCTKVEVGLSIGMRGYMPPVKVGARHKSS